jgi:hypothetical protein
VARTFDRATSRVALQNRRVARPYLPKHQPGGTATDLAGSVLLCGSVWAALAVLTPELVHPMALPLVICGGLAGVEAVQWLQGRRDSLDSASLLSLFLVHFFFLAPLLHVVLDWWAPFLPGLEDWRPWIGRMAVLNAVGLAGIRWVWNRPVCQAAIHRRWVPGPRFLSWWLLVVGVSAAAQLLAISRFGSPLGVSEAFDSGAAAFEGSGWILVMSEALPYLLLVGICEGVRRRGVVLSGPALTAVIIGFVVMTFLLAGFRGSRANIIWAALIGVMVIHLRLRRIRRRELMLLAVMGLTFMYIYGFYKSAGMEGLAAILDRSKQVELEDSTGRDLRTVVLGDLARADVQALTLARMSDEQDYELRLGSTYVAGALSLVPDRVLSLTIDDKRAAGTALLYERSESLGEYRVSNIYGLSGEAMLNFGPIAVPPLLLLFGFLSRAFLHWFGRLRPSDSREYIAPVGLVVLVLLIGSDLDNALYGFIKFGLLPAALVLGASVRVDTAYHREAAAEPSAGSRWGRT